MDRDERERLLEARTLLHLGGPPQSLATDALRASLPRTDDAMRLIELTRERLGERAWADPFGGQDPNVHLYPRATEDDRWLVPSTLAEVNLSAHPPSLVDFGPNPNPEIEAMLEAGRQRRAGMLPATRYRQPLLVMFNQGPAQVHLTYDPRGVLFETMRSVGDSWWNGRHPDQPFAIDPEARPPQTPPHHLLLYPELRKGGVPLEELADWLATLDPGRWHDGRVHLPCPLPDGATLTWRQGLAHLRRLFWADTLPADLSGWLVLDAWAGQVWTTGDTLTEATDRFKAAVAETCPMPARGEPPTPELPAPDAPDPMAELPEPDISPEAQGQIVGMQAAIRWEPPAIVPAPPVASENVPAIALRLGPARSPDPGWEALGFRVVRMVDEVGAVWGCLVRNEPRAVTLVPEALWDGLDPRTFEAQLAACEAQVAPERASLPREMRLDWDRPEYPIFHMNLRLLAPPCGRRYLPALELAGYGRSASQDFTRRTPRFTVEYYRRIV